MYSLATRIGYHQTEAQHSLLRAILYGVQILCCGSKACMSQEPHYYIRIIHSRSFFARKIIAQILCVIFTPGLTLSELQAQRPSPSPTFADLHFEQRCTRDTCSIRLQSWQNRRLLILLPPHSWQLDVSRSIFSNRRRREYIFLPLVCLQ